MTTSRLYHASAEHGRTLFTPQRFWHSAKYGLSGPLKDGQTPPAEMSVIHAVFAWPTSYPLYFAPREVKRMSLNNGCKNFRKAAEQLGIDPDKNREVFIFNAAEREKLRQHSFSIYEFDAASFTRTPNGEFISAEPVVPLSETALSDAIAQMESRGIELAFVADIEACYQRFKQDGIQFWNIAGVESVMQDFAYLKEIWGALA